MVVLLTNSVIENNFSTSIPIEIKYSEYIDAAAPKRTLILLHGYAETKDRLFKNLGSHLEGCYSRMLILNAPFPIPFLAKDGNFKEAYAWYFKSVRQNITLIPPEACETLFTHFLEQISLGPEPVHVLGFSQGGFIMPRLGIKIENLRQLIGISCGVSVATWPKGFQAMLNIIHGSEDSVLLCNESENQFQELGLDKSKNRFFKVGGGHDIDVAKIDLVKKLILET